MSFRGDQISKAKKGRGKREENPNWRGGKYTDVYGYVWVRQPEHPNAVKGGYIREHRFVMSRHLERPLKKGETIHHTNGDKADNRIENLCLHSTRSDHASFHYPTGSKFGKNATR